MTPMIQRVAKNWRRKTLQLPDVRTAAEKALTEKVAREWLLKHLR